jgi:hypothetical protein
MKQGAKLVAYLIFMALLISGTLFLARSAGDDSCPICNHSITSEGLIKHSTITINK